MDSTSAGIYKAFAGGNRADKKESVTDYKYHT